MTVKPLVYIVDDEQAVRDALALTVSLLDVEVAPHSSAQEFLAAFDPAREACLVLDLRMPETNGLQLLDLLRRRDPNLPVIVVSGAASVPDVVQAMKFGAIEFLEKPYVIAKLRDSVADALRNRRAATSRTGAQSAAVTLLDTLTPQELQVTQSTAAGEPDKAIAASLDVSTRTVQLRRASAMKKLRVASRADLIRLVHTADQPPALSR